MIASIGGVVGLTAGAAASAVADTGEVVAIFSLISAIGIGLYATGELTDPSGVTRVETTAEKHHRWARILTERAFRYAREGNCPRVRRVEKRVLFYDRELHDFVFMRDEEIAKCMHVVDPPSTSDSTESDPTPVIGPPVIGPPVIAPPVIGPPVIAPPEGAPPPALPPPSSVRDPAEP